MKKIIKPGPINLSNFSGDLDNLEAKFGLPSKVMFCRDCVVSNQRPSTVNEYEHTKDSKKETIKFNKNGQCSACQFAEKKKTEIKWKEREEELLELCNRYRSKDGQYDCIVPGSGGKDSVFTAHILNTKYGMHPLTVTWAPHIYTEWGWQNLQSWIKSGFDNYLLTPNAKVHRLLTRLAVENMFFPFQPFVFGQKSFAPKMALLFNIPLVFYGETGAEYGSSIERGSTPHRNKDTYAAKDIDSSFLGGVSIAELKENYGLEAHDLIPYLPANSEELFEKKVEVHRLGYYLQWHPQKCYYYAVEHCGFQPSPERTPGTYSKYNSIDDKVDDIYYYTAFIKFGIGRATSDAAQEIRSGDITRAEGAALVKRYDGEFPERFADEFFEYISINPKEYPVASKMFEEPIMDREYFKQIEDHFRSPHIWKYENNKWQLRNAVWYEENNGNVDQETEASNWTGNVYQV